MSSVCRIVGISRIARWISCLNVWNAKGVASRNVKTINGDTRLGMRKGSFSRASVESAGDRTRGTSSAGRWPFAVKRAGVPRNGALTNLTNSHLDSIIALMVFRRMRFYDTQRRAFARMNSDDLSLSPISFLSSWCLSSLTSANIRLSWNFADNSIFIRDSSLLANESLLFLKMYIYIFQSNLRFVKISIMMLMHWLIY